MKRIDQLIASTVFAAGALASAPVLAQEKVEFKTTLGNFTVELDAKAAPKTV
ncbi:MAG: hypothetical protein RL341_1259, partial [Pseudomonadota bacterium]